MRRVPCAIIRGGTSKGIFFLEDDLPRDPYERDHLLLRLFGSPHPRQIDGLGGAEALMSKVGIVSLRDRLHFTVGSVAVNQAIIEYRGNCGNLAAAVVPFALTRGLVKAGDGRFVTEVYNTNTDRSFTADIAVEAGQFQPVGELQIPGVPGSGSPVYLEFHDQAGLETGKLLPTGNPLDRVTFEGKLLPMTVVDVTDCVAFVSAQDVGVELNFTNGFEPEVIQRLERLRRQGAELIGVSVTPNFPKIALVGRNSEGHFASCTLSMGEFHRAYSVTGAICLAAAAKIPGTLPAQYTAPRTRGPVSFAHPTGIMEVEITIGPQASPHNPTCPGISAKVVRTARILMEGMAFV